MSERRVASWAAGVAAAAYAAPLGVLLIRAVADVWRAPAVLPQAVGARGWQALAHPGVVAATRNSLLVAGAATAAAVVLGWGAARVIAGRDTAQRRLLYVLVALPLLVPPYAVGVGLGGWFVRWGMIDTFAALVLAHLVYVLPYVVLLLAAGFGRSADALEEAAAVLGADRWQRLRLVVVPAVRPALAAAGLLGFVVSWSQYGTSLAVGGGVAMLPLVLLPFVGSDLQVASALALLFLVPPVVVLAFASWAARLR